MTHASVSPWRALVNFGRYLLGRIALLSLTLISAVYLTILIANLGGYVDTIVASRIEESAGFLFRSGWNADLPPDERAAAAEVLIAEMKDAAGLNDPFLWRAAQWLRDGLLLDWGDPTRARAYGISAAGMSVREIIADNLARTLFVFGVANVMLFGVAVLLALAINRHYGGWLDRLFVLLSPISAAPAWVFGVILTVFALRVFGFSPGGTFDSWPVEFSWTAVIVTLRHLLLPFIAVFLAGLFQSVYVWRSFFQIYSSEDYVDMAHAKGLTNRRIDRDYIVRPALPALLTSFALLLTVLWQEIIALEQFFNVQGLGRLFISALRSYDTPMIVAIVTTFAYLIALTVLVLDIMYALVDPRIRTGSRQAQSGALVSNERGRWRDLAQWPGRVVVGLRALRLPRPEFRPAELGATLREWGRSAAQTVRALADYPSAVIGLTIITIMLGVSVYTLIAIPYQEVVPLWRSDTAWARNPRSALPSWVNLFRRNDLPETLRFAFGDPAVLRETEALSDELTRTTLLFPFEYDYNSYPQEIIVDLQTQYETRGPHVTITWLWPDGSERELTGFQPTFRDTYFVSRDDRLKRRLRSDFPLQALFLGPDGTATAPVVGSYALRVEALAFEPDTTFDAEVNVLGEVYGLAGTDDQRRDLMIALLWGTPIALGFGLIAAVGTSIGGLIFAALAAWYGGIVDRIISYLIDVTLILPFFPVALMVFVLYSRSILVILAVTVALTLFGSSVKTYRATLLQIRALPYIEAARAYGAPDRRIVLRYMIPRVVSVLIPRMIILVPGYVFLEATLAFLGVSDPVLPTWGKLVVAALGTSIYTSNAHLVLAPLGLLFLTGFAFAMVGLALERVFDPRLRDR